MLRHAHQHQLLEQGQQRARQIQPAQLQKQLHQARVRFAGGNVQNRAAARRGHGKVRQREHKALGHQLARVLLQPFPVQAGGQEQAV